MIFDEFNNLIPVSLMLEYWYCPRFIYFMKVLNIKQNEEKHLKVLQGRTVHHIKKIAPDYLRKKLNITKQEKEVYLSDHKLGICGIVDEILTDTEGQISILDYKYALHKRKFKTQFNQLVFYSILAAAHYGKEVQKGYIIYTRSGQKPVEFAILEKHRKAVLKDIETAKKIICEGFYPKATGYKARCADCTYRNLCSG